MPAKSKTAIKYGKHTENETERQRKRERESEKKCQAQLYKLGYKTNICIFKQNVFIGRL